MRRTEKHGRRSFTRVRPRSAHDHDGARDAGSARFRGAGAGAATRRQVHLQAPDGKSFSLAKSIRDKIAAHKPLNYVFSYGSCSIQGFSQQYQAGYDASVPPANKIYPIKGKRLCPPQTQQDVNTQINQIQALLNTDQVDCLSIEPQSSTSMAALVAQTLAKGIPVYTVGLVDLRERADELHPGAREGRQDRGSHRGQLHEGAQAELQDVRRLGRRPDAVLGAEPREGLPGGDPGGDPGREVRHDREERCSTRPTTRARPTTRSRRS